MRRLALALALLLAPSIVHAQDLSCGTGDLEVRDVDFTGNQHFRGAELGRAIVTTPSSFARRVLHLPIGARRCLDTLELQRDVIRLRIFYRQRGYYKTTVDPRVSPTAPGAVEVDFRIAEGPPVLVDTLQILGLDSVPATLRSRLVRAFDPLRGGIYNKIALKAAIDSTVDRLQNSGYAHATEPFRDITVHDSTNRASVKLTFVPGARAHIARIAWDVEANQPGERPQIDTSTVKKLLSFHPGDLYRQRELLRSQRDLYALGTYRHVDLELLPDSLQPNDSALTVLVRLGEAKMKSMRVGIGWATLDCARTQARFTDRDFAGGARRLELSGRLSHLALCQQRVRDDTAFSAKLNYYASATLRLPTLFGPRNIPSFTLFSERTSEYRTYLRSTPVGAAAEVTRDLRPRAAGPGLPLTIGYRIEYGRTEADPAVFCQVFDRCTLADIDRLQRNSSLQVATLALARNRANNLLDPTRGSVLHLELRTGRTTADTTGAILFNRAYGEAAIYHPIGTQSVLAARLQLATVFQGWSFRGATGFVPPEERLYAGGPNSVRGYSQNLLGPVVYVVGANSIRDSVVDGRHMYVAYDTAGIRQFSPTGGNTLAVANLELRRRSPLLGDVVQLAAFVDAGLVWNRPEESVSLGDVRVTPGVGVRVNSPVGPFRVDVAYNRYPMSSGAAYVLDTSSRQLLCVSPGNPFDRGQLVPGETCPRSFSPAQGHGILNRLTFNFSIGQAF